MSPSERLILFTRPPVPGRTKTRLIPALGAAEAADLQRRMTEHAFGWGRALCRVRPLELEVCHDGQGRQVSAWLGPGPDYRPQRGDDLGARMSEALHRALSAGRARAVLMGADAPGLDRALLAHALDLLERHGVVLGPAHDGGYCLVGLSRPAPELFEAMPWGGSTVLERTLERTREGGLSVGLLPPLNDVDRPEDLRVWRGAPPPPPEPPAPGLISVVIPCLNEAHNLEAAVASARQDGQAVEVIVADGGSRDATCELALSLGCRLVRTPAGRGRQIAAGAGLARGEIVLTLHADTRLPPGWGGEARRILADPGAALGAFALALDAPGAGFRLIEKMVRLRGRYGKLPYGDQGLFMRAVDLRALGGPPEIDLMEDVALVRAARRLGRVEISRLPALSSARRWREKGIWANTLQNWLTYAAYVLGADPDRLARRYYRRRQK